MHHTPLGNIMWMLVHNVRLGALWNRSSMHALIHVTKMCYQDDRRFVYNYILHNILSHCIIHGIKPFVYNIIGMTLLYLQIIVGHHYSRCVF